MKRIKPIQVEQNATNQINVTSTTWTQWGKAAFVFTVATGVYAVSKIIGNVWENDNRQSNKLTTTLTPDLINQINSKNSYEIYETNYQEDLINLKSSSKEERIILDDVSLNPLVTLSALALTAPRYSYATLTAFGLSLFNQMQSTQAAFPAEIDLSVALNSTQGFIIQGEVANDRVGCSVSSIGDVNGDNIEDFLVGAQYATGFTGRAYIIFGRNENWQPTLDLTNLNTTQGVRLQGALVGDYAGVSVAGTGDVNGDGISDMVIGASDADPFGRSFAGQAYIIFGRNDSSWPALINLASLDVTVGVTIYGASVNDQMGGVVSGSVDLNYDGINDILLNAHTASPLGRTEAGAIYIVFGRNTSWPATLDLAAISNTDGVFLQGATAGDWTGLWLSGTADINGDGIDDFLVGPYRASPLGRSGAGVAYIIFGRNGTWPATLDLNALGSQGVTLQGAEVNAAFGFGVRGIGDTNRDGIADIFIGAGAGPAFYIIYGRNESWPISLDMSAFNSTMGLLFTVNSSAYNTSNPYASQAHFGDVNGDGFEDILVSTPAANPMNRTYAGVAYLIYGQSAPISSGFDLATLTPNQGVVILGKGVSNDYLGISTNVIRDINGDGLKDIVLGALNASPLNRYQAGAVYVIYGQRDELYNASNVTSTYTDTIESRSTSIISRLGDTSSNSQSNSTQQSQISDMNSGMSIETVTISTPGFFINSNTVLYAEIGVEVIITTENLSVEGFTGDPNQLIFSIPENPAYTVTVNGEEQNSFPLWAIQQDFVGLTLGDEFCFEDFNEIPVQVTDGRSTADFNLVFRGNTASCTFNDAATLNARSSLQGVAMLLVSSGLGLLTSKRREKPNDKKTESNLLINDDDNVKMKLSA